MEMTLPSGVLTEVLQSSDRRVVFSEGARMP